MVLELFLSAEDDGIRRVVVEMNLDEARAFVNKLKAIEKVRLIACLIVLIGSAIRQLMKTYISQSIIYLGVLSLWRKIYSA